MKNNQAQQIKTFIFLKENDNFSASRNSLKYQHFQEECHVFLPLLSTWMFQISSVAQLCLTLCDPMDYSMEASLSITNSWSLLKLMSIKSVISSKRLILCHSLLLLPSIFPSIRVFSNGSALCIRWPKYWTFSFNISPSNEHSGLMSLRID